MNQSTLHRYETGISSNNLKHWGMLEVVKEFVQNVVYAKSILGNEISITHDGTHAILKNMPGGFTKGKLLIGESEQANVDGAPGQYGEGLKVAMSVARRENKHVFVETNGFSVSPELEPSSLDSSVDALVFYLEDTDNVSGTTVTVECSQEVLAEAISHFALLNGVSGDLLNTNSILEDVRDSVYVNGVRVAKVNSVLSYNFVDSRLMNRDRSSVNMDMVKGMVGAMMSRISDVSLASVVLQSILEDDSLIESQATLNPVLFDDKVWKEAAKVVFDGKKVAMATGLDSDTKARYHKFKVLTGVPTGWKYLFNNVLDIPYTDDLIRVVEKPKNIHRKPSTEENTNLGWAKRLIRLYYGDYGTVKISEEVFDGFGNPVMGLYERATDTTWIKKSLLESKEDTFKTLLHETIHRLTGASDNTAEFTRAWEDACWKIMNRGRV